MTDQRPRALAWVFASTIFVSAFLLFQVQPIISKFILPWFGGTPAVWTTCMMFFQTVLFLGYAYAFFSQRFLRPAAAAVVHIGLIVAALGMLPIQPDDAYKATAEIAPAWSILMLLATSVGLPYFVLSSTGPLVQAWFSRTYPGRSPYRLYALSNLGSLLALLSFPFYFEPRFALGPQAMFWSIGFLMFAGLCAWGAVRSWWIAPKTSDDSRNLVETGTAKATPAIHRVLWIALPAWASLMLLATTNHVCQDVAVIPFLWVVPLSLYLLSFIITFDHPRWYHRRGYAIAALALLGAVILVDQLITTGSGIRFNFIGEIGLHFAALFALCMVCHGELVRLRPEPRQLTAYYLMISAGGALGGMFVSLVAPSIFDTFFEWKLGLVGGCLTAAAVLLSTQANYVFRPRVYLAAPALLLLLLGMNYAPQLTGQKRMQPEHRRSFYGVVSVVERDSHDPQQHRYEFFSGRIVHGIQFVAAERKREATAYFGLQSGVGSVLTELRKRGTLNIGVIGQGIGTLATYAEPGDTLRFYEINPEVVRVADEQFTFMRDCRGRADVVIGDGRLSLEREAPRNLDLLVLDAFSADSVPTHLLTKEAFETYLKHLKPNGVIAANVSNRYLNLDPIVRGLAKHYGLECLHISSTGGGKLGQFPADFMVLAHDGKLLDPLRPLARAEQAAADLPLWTDDHTDLFGILK